MQRATVPCTRTPFMGARKSNDIVVDGQAEGGPSCSGLISVDAKFLIFFPAWQVLRSMQALEDRRQRTLHRIACRAEVPRRVVTPLYHC